MSNKEEKKKEEKGDVRPIVNIVGFEVFDGQHWIPCEKEIEAKILSELLTEK